MYNLHTNFKIKPGTYCFILLGGEGGGEEHASVGAESMHEGGGEHACGRACNTHLLDKATDRTIDPVMGGWSIHWSIGSFIDIFVVFLYCLLRIRCIVYCLIVVHWLLTTWITNPSDFVFRLPVTAFFVFVLPCSALIQSIVFAVLRLLQSYTWTCNLIYIEIAPRNPARPRELSHAVFLSTTLENYRSRQEFSIECHSHSHFHSEGSLFIFYFF